MIIYNLIESNFLMEASIFKILFYCANIFIDYFLCL